MKSIALAISASSIFGEPPCALSSSAILAALGAFLLAGLVCPVAGAETPAASIALVKDGKSAYRIVTATDSGPEIETAARELQNLLNQMTGVRLPIVKESEAGGGPAILLGACEKSRKAGLLDKAATLREDGVLLRTLGDDLALLGQNPRGNLYAVYVFLEKYLGIRYLAWDSTHVPERKDVTLPSIDYSYAPPFMYRETLYFDSFPKEIAARQRLNGPYTKCDASVGGKIEFFPYVHSFDDLFPEKEYFTDHPEYYGLQGGKRVAGDVHAQICLSNPDVLRIAKQKVLQWIEEHPDVPIFDVSQNDGNGACECEACATIVKEEGSQHGPILRFVNAIADEVAKKHPDRWVETLAYAYSVVPPTKTRPRDNVIIRLCHAGCFFHGFETCKQGSDLALWIDQWSQLTKRIFIWHYATNFAHYLAPNPNLDGLAKDIKYYAAHNVNGLMIQCNYQGPGGELAELRQYLSARLLWDPSLDPMEIRTEFCRLYYGKAAKTVLEFLALMDEQGRKPTHAFAVWDPGDVAPPDFVNGALEVLSKARADAAGDAVIENRIDKLMLPFWYVQVMYPARHNFADADARDALKSMRGVIEANDITHIKEGGAPNAADWLAAMEARLAAPVEGVVFNLLRADLAKTQHCADWCVVSVRRNGDEVASIVQHPDGVHDADAVYTIDLPKDKKLALTFATVIANATDDGVRFSVRVDDKEVWSEQKKTYIVPEKPGETSAHDAILPTANPFTDHTIDLSEYAGKTIRLTLRVNALENSKYDWANWVAPKIVEVKPSAGEKAP